MNLLDPSGVRLKLAGLFSGGASTGATRASPTVTRNTPGSTAVETDWRVRLSLASKKDANFYQDAGQLQSILARTNGVIFPYTPSLSIVHNARYSEQALTHSNYKNYFYEGSDVGAINIVGDFTVQSLDEGLYLLAALYFFRSCTKMFQASDVHAGNPPPLVFLDGYGDFLLPHVPGVITTVNHSLPPEVDYVDIPFTASAGQKVAMGSSAKHVRLPTSSQINIVFQPIYSRKNIHDNFNLTDFAQGKLLTGGFL